MPTYEETPHFHRDLRKLTTDQRKAFTRARQLFVKSLQSGLFHPGLRVKKLGGTEDVWELAWAPDGRATFEFGNPVKERHPHIVWRRIGTHEILRRP